MICPSFLPDLFRFVTTLTAGRDHLEFHDFARRSFPAFRMERGTRRVSRKYALSLPAGIWIIDSPVDPLSVETHRIRYSERHELAVDERDQPFGFVAGRHRDILSDAEHVEAIYEVVVRRVGTGSIDGILKVRAGKSVERPTFRTMFSSRIRFLQRAFALAAIETGQLPAG